MRTLTAILITAMCLTAGAAEPPGPAPQGERSRGRERPEQREPGQKYSVEQAVSDRAQLHTIAFSGLAFLTGDIGSDTWFPPGKVSDFFGFQYMRDVDAGGRGHSPWFLTTVANNMLALLNDGQKARLTALAASQEKTIREFARSRFPLIWAFRRHLAGEVPEGSGGLNRDAVVACSAALYEIDGLMAYERAKAMAAVLGSLDEKQREALAKLKFGDSRTWPEAADQLDRRSMSHDAHVAVMTYASEMFSWQGGSVEADTYFCPERHGMYFGAFYVKGAPAHGKRSYNISTELTGDAGGQFLETLTPAQREKITRLVDLQRKELAEIVTVRRAIATELRRFLAGAAADLQKVLALSRRYGELDGEMSYRYATAFAEVGRTLTDEQRRDLLALRNLPGYTPKGAFLYADAIDMPKAVATDFLFVPPADDGARKGGQSQ